MKRRVPLIAALLTVCGLLMIEKAAAKCEYNAWIGIIFVESSVEDGSADPLGWKYQTEIVGPEEGEAEGWPLEGGGWAHWSLEQEAP